MDEVDKKYKEIVESVNTTVSSNLKKLLEARGLSQRQFCQKMAEEKISVTRSYFNKILKDHKYISAAFLLSCCDFFGITLQNLVSEDFDASEYISNDTRDHKDYLNIQAILKNCRDKEKDVSEERQEEEEFENEQAILQWKKFESGNLITDPSNTMFKGYLQNYYCYFYPTDSAQNKDDGKMVKGILQLKAEKNYCKATLKIDTNIVDECGNTNYKLYEGVASISPAVFSVNCIMYSEDICEFCFIMFRFFKINYGKQNCRIAEALSSSSSNEDRRPTVLRMLLSQEPLAEQDLKAVAPSLFLNYSTIAISEEKLKEIGKVSEDYNNIINEITGSSNSCKMHFLKETMVFNMAEKYIKKKEDIYSFLMLLRSESYAYRYNKVSKKADDIMRKILLSRGYYKNKN